MRASVDAMSSDAARAGSPWRILGAMFGPLKKSSRLGQWNGRRRSSRSELPLLPHLGQRPVLIRLAVVLATVALATLLACTWGPTLPYRVGEVLSRDLRARVDFELVNQPQTELAREQALDRLPPEKRDDPAARPPPDERVADA